MVEAADIKDRASLEAWLADQPREVAVWIATRAALRVGPLLWRETAPRKKVDLTSLPFLRALLIAEAGGTISPREIRKKDAAFAAANYATSAFAAFVDAAAFAAGVVAPADFSPADFATASASAATSAVFASVDFDDRSAFSTAFVADLASSNFDISAVFAAVFAADASSYAASRHATAGQASAGFAARDANWSEVKADAVLVLNGKVPAKTALWNGDSSFYPDPWPEVRASWQNAGPGWKFWTDWYEAILSGRQMNLKMLKEIALIDAEGWDSGADHVNAMIMDIRLNCAEKLTNNAERVEPNPETGKLRVVSETLLPAEHLADATDKMRDANANFEGEGGANDMYATLLPERQIIDDAVERYSQRPMRLYDACRRASRRVSDKIAQGDCPPNDALISDYVRQLDEVAVDIRGFDDVVKDVTATRVLEAMKDLPEEVMADFVQAADEIAQEAEGYLAEELPVEARKAIDLELPESERKEALNVTTGRLVRSLKVGRTHLKNTAAFVKDVSIVSGAGAATGAVVVDGYLFMTGKLPIVLPWLLSLF